MPQSPAEWQHAVDAAEFYLLFDSARQYGLVAGGPVINAERCSDLLIRGAALGYQPAPHHTLVARFLARGDGDAGT